MVDAATGPLFFRRERLWPIVLASAAAHAAILAWGALHRPPPVIDLEQKPIVAKLVRLGEKRPEAFLPRKEEAPPPPTAPPSIPVPGPAAKAPTPAAKPGPATARPDPLASALNRIRREQALGAPPRYGDPTGSPEGEASEDEGGDRYLALVTQVLKANYRLPSTLSEKDRMFLKATVVLSIEPDGRVSGFRFEQRSGNASFDDALARAIRQTRLPPPPADMRERYRSVGLGVHFHM
ncbi:MAG: energy transducer TonB [Myxococcaceae bacterium]